MRGLFEQRPIWTRRALLNQFPDDAPFYAARYLIAYVAYAIRSGPWRDTFCKFGVDPRTDRSYRKYQSVLIQLVPRDRDKTDANEEYARSWARSKDKTSHIFTGQHAIPPDGKIWQLCDLADPFLRSLVDVPDIYIRPQCETRYFGWYNNGTIAKIRVILKAKVDALSSGESVDETALAKFSNLPDCWDSTEGAATNDQTLDPVTAYLPKDAGKKELEWASAYRSICRTVAGAVPQSGGSGKGRLSKTKPTMRSSFIGAEESPLVEEANTLKGYEEPEEGDDGLNEGKDEENNNAAEDARLSNS
jgi:general transcription factor 3C polypeptide 5 (transcription factor C subunit 1)